MPGGLPHLASLRFSGPESRACCPAKTVPWPGKPSAMPEPLAGGGRSSDDGQVMLPLPPPPRLLPCLPREGVVLAGQSLQQQVNKPPTFLGTGCPSGYQA